MHANSPAEVPARLEALGALGGLEPRALHSQVAAAVRIVLHMRRDATTRYLSEIGVFEKGDGLAVRPVWTREHGWRGEELPW